jgi:general secretion pathway protein I
MRFSTASLKDRPSGFTLVEVLIALAVASIVFLGGLKLLQTVSQSLFESRDRSLAMLCADNALLLIRLQTRRQTLADGQEICNQGSRVFMVRTKVLNTPHANFRRIETRVYLADLPEEDFFLAYRVGFLPLGF